MQIRFIITDSSLGKRVDIPQTRDNRVLLKDGCSYTRIEEQFRVQIEAQSGVMSGGLVQHLHAPSLATLCFSLS